MPAVRKYSVKKAGTGALCFVGSIAWRWAAIRREQHVARSWSLENGFESTALKPLDTSARDTAHKSYRPCAARALRERGTASSTNPGDFLFRGRFGLAQTRHVTRCGVMAL